MSMITTEDELRELVDHARRSECVALDTEFVWERTYYPQLGLIQLALSDEQCYLIDPLAITDLSPLGALLADPGVVKILHDAPQDLFILNRTTRALPANIFDTRVAAGFSGLSSTISLADLIGVLLDINLQKTQTRTNWLNRPLDQLQLDYALDDVRYLGAVRVLLLSRIIVPEIKSWLKRELELLNSPDHYLGIDDRNRFSRLKGAGSLNREELAVARELATWREQEARHMNRPRGHILTDQVVISLAKKQCASPAELQQAHLLSPKKLKRYGPAILKSIENGRATDRTEIPERKRPLRLNQREQQAYERLTDFIQLKCELQGLDPQLIGSSAELKQLAKNLDSPGSPLPKRLTEGWRREFLEEFYRRRG
ncbi:ribonuclease D [Desulfofustis glycolicus]|uniref:Ribonuclease D n=1 Tax=Desulfofustis glycolicus DSM 9705 TaxID=1121409 RepID=A0A1M5VSP4_9BACT|nr:HRDC domain-containing protein [Desulfofustis glycolicus]MCB2216753.1 ribonuclease D [Desulfobulbaceae bacterium]SHH78004.1 ribonuclease D [Desulfofustis glycolicus DSM 9705]